MSDLWLLLVVGLPLLALWLAAVVEVARRGDLSARRRALWVAGLVLVPVFGLGAYVVVRPPRPPRGPDRTADTSTAEAIVLAAERRQRGELTDGEYLAQVTDLVSVD